MSLECVRLSARLRCRTRGKRGRYPPNGVSDVIGDQQSASSVDCQTNRPSARVIVRIEKACDDILRRPAWLSAAKRNENNFVTVKRRSIPTSVFAHERTAAIVFGKRGARVHDNTQWRYVRA